MSDLCAYVLVWVVETVRNYTLKANLYQRFGKVANDKKKKKEKEERKKRKKLKVVLGLHH